MTKILWYLIDNTINNQRCHRQHLLIHSNAHNLKGLAQGTLRMYQTSFQEINRWASELERIQNLHSQNTIKPRISEINIFIEEKIDDWATIIWKSENRLRKAKRSRKLMNVENNLIRSSLFCKMFQSQLTQRIFLQRNFWKKLKAKFAN